MFGVRAWGRGIEQELRFWDGEGRKDWLEV
jgi:hypothetical protein